VQCSIVDLGFVWFVSKIEVSPCSAAGTGFAKVGAITVNFELHVAGLVL
jgi:hypothetical protein